MKIVVCIKQVPDTKGGVKFNPDGTLDRAAMMTIMNPDDKAGLEAALRLKDQYGAEVTVVTMGLPKAEEVLREAKETALREMEEQAMRMGANAVIGVDLDYETVGQNGSMLMVTASGTAVFIQDL